MMMTLTASIMHQYLQQSSLSTNIAGQANTANTTEKAISDSTCESPAMSAKFGDAGVTPLDP